jgi:hypothetical protein
MNCHRIAVRFDAITDHGDGPTSLGCHTRGVYAEVSARATASTRPGARWYHRGNRTFAARRVSVKSMVP